MAFSRRRSLHSSDHVLMPLRHFRAHETLNSDEFSNRKTSWHRFDLHFSGFHFIASDWLTCTHTSMDNWFVGAWSGIQHWIVRLFSFFFVFFVDFQYENNWNVSVIPIYCAARRDVLRCTIYVLSLSYVIHKMKNCKQFWSIRRFTFAPFRYCKA